MGYWCYCKFVWVCVFGGGARSWLLGDLCVDLWPGVEEVIECVGRRRYLLLAGDLGKFFPPILCSCSLKKGSFLLRLVGRHRLGSLEIMFVSRGKRKLRPCRVRRG